MHVSLNKLEREWPIMASVVILCVLVPDEKTLFVRETGRPTETPVWQNAMDKQDTHSANVKVKKKRKKKRKTVAVQEADKESVEKIIRVMKMNVWPNVMVFLDILLDLVRVGVIVLIEDHLFVPEELILGMLVWQDVMGLRNLKEEDVEGVVVRIEEDLFVVKMIELIRIVVKQDARE